MALEQIALGRGTKGKDPSRKCGCHRAKSSIGSGCHPLNVDSETGNKCPFVLPCMREKCWRSGVLENRFISLSDIVQTRVGLRLKAGGRQAGKVGGGEAGSFAIQFVPPACTILAYCKTLAIQAAFTIPEGVSSASRIRAWLRAWQVVKSQRSVQTVLQCARISGLFRCLPNGRSSATG